MKILALDISTSSTGWFVSKASYGKIEPAPALSFPDKLCFFRDEIEKLLVCYKPEVVVIEDTYFRFGNVHTLKQLVKFGAVAMEVAARRKIQVETITATQARKFCCGKQEGEFKKKEVFAYFVNKYGLHDWKFSSHNDITDAMALHWGYREKQAAKKKADKKKARREAAGIRPTDQK